MTSTLGGKCETTQNGTFFSSDELLPFSDELLLSLPQPFVSHGNLCHGKNGEHKTNRESEGRVLDTFWGKNVFDKKRHRFVLGFESQPFVAIVGDVAADCSKP